MQTLKKLLFLLTPNERKHAVLLLVMIIIMALLDTIGVASIYPFMTVLTNPQLVETNIILNKMYQFSVVFGVENNQQFLFALGVLMFITLVISIIFKALTSYIQVRFVLMREYSFSKRLVEGYLHQPYSWFLNRHSADLGKTILSEVANIIGSGVTPMMTLISTSMVTIAIVTLLIIADPYLAVIVGISFSAAYGIVFYFTRKILRLAGAARLQSNQLRFTTVIEAFGASKEIKVGGLEQTYIDRFSRSAKIFARSQASEAVISLLPRFILEIIAFGGVLLIILTTMSQSGNFNTILPIISLYVFAGYRLMPALQQIYGALTQLTFVGPSLNQLHEDIKSLSSFDRNTKKDLLPFDKSITLKNTYYNYPNSSRTALKNINLNIPVKSTVGIVGPTGSGKSTTVDIILGLLEPQKGTLEVDGQVITKQNSRSWQRSIGYVPQSIFLADDTVAANIAFGIEPKDINQEAVEKAAKIANLHNFVSDELPKKYQTTIGERGVRLSGGQRQRIGVARALYHNPQVLILDEATSALDNQTEQAVMDAINNLGKSITIILIAHRLSTVKNCDNIFFLLKGELNGQGKFEDLIIKNSSFSKMQQGH